MADPKVEHAKAIAIFTALSTGYTGEIKRHSCMNLFFQIKT
jgi:hypothetical protein